MTISISSILQPSKKGKRRRIDHALILGAVLFFVAAFILLPQVRSLFSPKQEEQAVVPIEATPGQIFSWSGKITKVSNDQISIATDSDSNQTVKVAEITPGTRITALVFTPIFSNGQKRFVAEDNLVSAQRLRAGMHVEALAPMDISQHDTFPSVHIRILP